MNPIVKVQNVDFDAIREDVKNILREKEGFTDVDFSGSVVSTLVDILAYFTAVISYNVNVGVNELFLESARLRKNVVSHAKAVSYTPRRPVASSASLRIKLKNIPAGADSEYKVFLPKNTVFTAGGYDFRTKDIVVLTMGKDESGADVVSAEFTVWQLKKDLSLDVSDTFDPEKHSEIVIPSFNVENSSLTVKVENEYGELEEWLPDSDITVTEIGPDTKVYFVDEVDGGIRIRFGNGEVGMRPQTGASFSVETYLTDGATANGVGNFQLDGPEEGTITDTMVPANEFTQSDFDVETLAKSTGGADIESIESIRANAPRYYAAQRRLVTEQDYVSVLTSADAATELLFFPHSVNVWGGDRHIPRNLGTVYVSIAKEDGNGLTDEEKQRVVDFLDQRSVVTIQHKVVDPEKLYVTVRSNVRVYSWVDVGTVRQQVTGKIVEYLSGLGRFNTFFRKSRITTIVDGIEGVASNGYERTLEYEIAGNGARRVYKFLLENVKPGSVRSSFAGKTLVDDGRGAVLFGGEKVGEIDYSTGAFFVIFPSSAGVVGKGSKLSVSFDVTTDDFRIDRNKILATRGVYVNVERLRVSNG